MKRTYIYDTLEEPLRYKIGMDPRDTTYIQGSFTAEPQLGKPDISFYSKIFIRETNQMWHCGQFWLNDVHRDPDNDLITEHAERVAADTALQEQIDVQAAQITAIGLKVDNLTEEIITMDEYRALKPKEFKTYFVAKDEADKAKYKCWRIYLRSQLIGEFDSSGHITLPKFPMRFPFRFA